MERLTLDTRILFCDISQCSETPGGSFCEDGYCDQRRCYERLREYERLGDIDDLTALVKARDDGRVVVLPCKVGERVILNRWPYLVEGFSCDDVGQWKVRLAADVPKFVRNQRGHWYMSFKAFERKTRAEAEAELKGANNESSKV